jgi:4-diphosphocytidyl-2-C-methyl-D-erythritol kinase
MAGRPSRAAKDAGPAVRIRAHAKINLSLRVVGVRPDGYHELQTVFQSIALHDTLTIRAERGPFRLECDDPACPADRRNLVWRAVEAMWDAAGRRGDVHGLAIRLTKRIPIEGGLGGGSSDAAAAVRAVGTLLRVDSATQRSAAASLGADVPYFFEGGTALGLGRGDALFPLIDRPRAWVALVIPPFGISTKEAFGWWDEGPHPAPAAMSAAGDGNDLQDAVSRHHPEIGRLVKALRKAGATTAAISGSGSTVFGLFAGRTDAERAAAALGGRGRRTVVARTIDRATYQRLAGIQGHRIHSLIAPRSASHA